jgi:hypothetical protein
MSGTACVEFAALELADEGALSQALERLGVLSAPPAVRPEELSAAITLRDAVRRVFAAVTAGAPLPLRDVETLNSYAADEPPIAALTAQGRVRYVATAPVRCGLSALARDAIAAVARRPQDLRWILLGRLARETPAVVLDATVRKPREGCGLSRAAALAGEICRARSPQVLHESSAPPATAAKAIAFTRFSVFRRPA